MKRVAIKVILFLLLGAILNIALAWTLCQASGVGHDAADGSEELTDAYRQVWQRYAPHGFAVQPDDLAPFTDRIGFRAFQMYADREDLDPVDHFVELAVIKVAGWPQDSLIGYEFLRMNTSAGITPAWVEHSNRFLRLRTKERPGDRPTVWLPIVPLWPGFAINTIFYAAILWLLFAIPFALRRRRRIKRGLCPACAYDLRGNDSKTCPECGTAVTQ